MAGGFLEKLFSLFGGGKDPEAAKKRQLKQLARELAGNKFSRFYRTKTEEADGSLGKIFYDIYRNTAPAQVLLQNAAKSAQLKQTVVEAFFDKKLLELRARISPEYIAERAKTAALKDLAGQLEDDLAAFSTAFDSARIDACDRCYNLILDMIRFVCFDYFFLLKKFDSGITERNFSYQPKFGSVRGEYISDDLKDFLEISFALDPDQDWKNTLRILKIYKNNMDVVAPDQWNRLLLFLRELRRSGVLELVIRHIDKNPSWQSQPLLSTEKITAAYLEERRVEAKNAVGQIVNAKKNTQVEALVKMIFGSAEIERAKYYTAKGGEIYVKKNFDGFIFAPAVNYLKAFLLDHFKRDIRELCDLLLIRGQWVDPSLSQNMSEAFHRLMGLSDELIAFDETLSDTGENGSRLKAAVIKADRDKSQARYVGLILKSVNESAQTLISVAARNLIALAKGLKILLEDYQKPSRELIMNWKEMEVVSESPIAQRMAGVYKKIYYFVQVLQLLVKNPAP
ncbi:MAG: DUF5312 family protein [Treponema sp.]|jgi:hypothetical protein|nr:DUF5312 family protein [Treponema sp.]